MLGILSLKTKKKTFMQTFLPLALLLVLRGQQFSETLLQKVFEAAFDPDSYIIADD